MTEREYYKLLNEATGNDDCEKCVFGIEEKCHLECDRSYNDYLRENKEFLESMDLLSRNEKGE